MPFYFILIALLSLLTSGILIRFFINNKKNIPVELFIEALQIENEGDYEKAILTYETALLEVNKKRFNNILKNKIIEKLKLLHAMIEYKKGFQLSDI